MTNTTFVTLTAAKKRLEQAQANRDKPLRGPVRGYWGRDCHSKLEAGRKTSRERAVMNARALVELMEARGLQRIEKLVLKGDMTDPGFTTVFLNGAEVLLVQHSSIDRFGLGIERQRELDSFLEGRK